MVQQLPGKYPGPNAGVDLFGPDAPRVTINCDMGEGYGKWKMVDSIPPLPFRVTT
jgi:hypothetical protein